MEKLSTDPYKGTRDFYPRDMAVQRYIFDTWARTAELFGFERYDASVLEPVELYRSKTSDEIVNEQTYSFVDRGDREVTLRPEMTPTVARMIAGKRHDLTFPIRWYSIPNLFRYERPQRGRLREHWQLNCDMFGTNDISSDIEMIALASHILTSFGAQESDFEIRINDRAWLNQFLKNEGLSEDQSSVMCALLDRKDKVDNFDEAVVELLGRSLTLPQSYDTDSTLAKVIGGLSELGIHNVVFSPTTVRGFTYYTGTIFEIFDTSSENNRSLLGGGRYDNLTGAFGGDPISGIGFGMGDVVMRDFLQTHNLLEGKIKTTAPMLAILPMDEACNLEGEKIAHSFRSAGVRTSVDFSDKKIGKKIGNASDVGVIYVLVVGHDEISSQTFVLKNLHTTEEIKGTLPEIMNFMSTRGTLPNS